MRPIVAVRRGGPTAIARVMATVLTAVGWIGCTAGSGPPPTDLAPRTVAATPAEVPLEWFVENWGPFDADRVGHQGSRQLPLVLIDGVQMYRRSLQDVDLTNGVAQPTREEIRHIRVVKGHSGAGLFGPAGCGGVIMVFTHDYEGPMPVSRKLADPPPCRAATR